MSEVERFARVVRALGDDAVAKHLQMSRIAVTRFALGLPVHHATKVVATNALPELEAALPPLRIAG